MARRIDLDRGDDRGDDLRRVRLQGCAKSASLTSAPSTRPKLKSGSACGASAEDVLEQDDAGRLVRHAGVDLRGGPRSSRRVDAAGGK